jgi:hypothetical protein
MWMQKAVSGKWSKGFLTGLCGTALATLLLAGTAQGQSVSPATKGSASQTRLSIDTDNQGARTRATFAVHVSAEDRSTAPTGTVSVMLGSASIGSASLNADGEATVTADALPRGNDPVRAVYNGDAHFAASASATTNVQSQASGVPDFTLTADPSTASVSPGEYATVKISVTPENGFNNSVTLSCTGGLPAASQCTFSPVNATPDGTHPATSILNIQTRTAAASLTPGPLPGHGSHVAFALLLPGIGGLLVLGFRRRSSALRIFAIAGLLVVSGAGLSSCAARYDYLHFPPVNNPGTPAGTYNITINGFSNNGSAVTTHTLQYVTLTVK